MNERVEILTIGDELLDGRVADTNTLTLANGLASVGQKLSRRTTITDDVNIIGEEARAIARRGTTLCVVSGGLGPTADDVTSAAFANLLGVDLVRDQDTVKNIVARLQKRGRPFTENQKKQADHPRGSTLLRNTLGTAPGFSINFSGCCFVAFPGVPKEFSVMLHDYVIKPMQNKSQGLLRHAFYCFGIIEAEADQAMTKVADSFEGLRLGFRVKFPEVHVTLHADRSLATSFTEAVVLARTQLGRHIFSEVDQPFASTVIDCLRSRNATLAVAESCTGGLVGDMLTDISGCSAVFLGGVVAYHNTQKTDLLAVHPRSLDTHGAVSEEVVKEMALGIRRRTSSTFGLAVSGIAGPDGGTADKPVGTVWLACATPTEMFTRHLFLPFDRRGNKVVSAYSVLDLLRRHLLE